MKKLILSLLIVASSSSAFAVHPEDTDHVRNIGTGTQLIVTADVNIKPNSQYINGETSSCWFALVKAESYDQVLKAGTRFTITSISGSPSSIINVNNPKVKYIYCVADTTIGKLKSEFQKSFKVQLAEPTQF